MVCVFLSAREAAIWDLEERRLHESTQLAKRQIQQLFELKKRLTAIRHAHVSVHWSVCKNWLFPSFNFTIDFKNI